MSEKQLVAIGIWKKGEKRFKITTADITVEASIRNKVTISRPHVVRHIAIIGNGSAIR